MSIVVSDASALIALERIEQPAFLERLFATLLILPPCAHALMLFSRPISERALTSSNASSPTLARASR